MQTMVTLAALVFAAFLGQVAAQSPTPFHVEGCLTENRCSCEIISNWSILEEYHQLRRVKRELVSLQQTIGSLNVQTVVTRMNNITHRISALEMNIDHQSVGITLQEISSLRRSVDLLIPLVEEMRQNGDDSERLAEISQELQSIALAVDALWTKNPYAENGDIAAELEALRKRLEDCTGNVKLNSFLGDTLPISHKYDHWCDTHELDTVGDAYTHRWVPQAAGAWFKDPVPLSDANKTEIFYRPYGGNIYMHSYANYTDFIGGKNQVNKARFNAHGIGYIMYNQSVYWAYGATIYKYDISRGAQQQQGIVMSNIDYLSQGLNSKVDLKVDEYGLWLIVASPDNDNKLVVTKVDPVTLRLGPTYQTNKHKVATCAVFMACGTLYTIDNCAKRLPLGRHQTQYVFDTRLPRAERESNVQLHITSKYDHIYSLNYNPRERVIFGWDNRHLVTYPITWKVKGSQAEPELPEPSAA